MLQPEQGKPKQIEEKIPEKYLKTIEEVKGKKAGLINAFLQLSVKLVKLQTQQKETLDKIDNANESLGAKIKDAFTKMRLKKKDNYAWTYNGGDSFVGIERPPKKEEKK